MEMKNVLLVIIVSFSLGVVRGQTTNTKVVSDTLESSFLKFWQTFRQAVIDNDTNKIISLTIFPFKTRGEMDSDPIIKYDRKKFAKVFHAYLYQSSGDIDGTEFDEIKKTVTPDKKDIYNEQARIGDLEFKVINRQWRLAFAYLHIQDEDLWKR